MTDKLEEIKERQEYRILTLRGKGGPYITALPAMWDISALLEIVSDLQKENQRLIDEIKRPICNDCGVEIGDNWCADCASKAFKEQNGLV